MQYCFTQDNTEGYSDTEIAEMNAKLERELAASGFTPEEIERDPEGFMHAAKSAIDAIANGRN